MQKLKPITIEELKQHKPCQKAMDFIQSCDNSVEKAWNECNNLHWMLWYLYYVEKSDKDLFNTLSNAFDVWAKENLSARAYACADARADAGAYADAHAHAYTGTYAYANADAYARAYAYARAQLSNIIRTIITF